MIETADVDTPAIADRLPWYKIWIEAAFRPSVATYRNLLDRPRLGWLRAYLWVYLASLTGPAWALSFVLYLLTWFLWYPGDIAAMQSPFFSGALWDYGFVWGVPIAAFLLVLSIAVAVALDHLIAGALGGTGSYSDLAYATAAYLAPLSLFFLITGALLLTIVGIFIYGLVLNSLALRAIHGFSRNRALIASALFGAITLVVLIEGLSLIGPLLSDFINERIDILF